MGLTFLVCHAKKNGAKIVISIPHITVVTPIEDYVRVYTDDGDFTDITDDFDDILEAIEKMAGYSL